MVRTMSARDARANFSDMLGSVYYTREPVIVEKKGKPVAVVVSPDEYETLEWIKRRGVAAIERIREHNVDKDPDEVLAEITEIVEDVRQELYEEDHAASHCR